MIEYIPHAVLVADARWIRALTEGFDRVLSVKVKTFEPSQIEDARHWLATPV